MRSLFDRRCIESVCRLPLEGMKRKVLRNLRLLESENLVNSSDDYQDIINAIAKVRETPAYRTSPLLLLYQ